MTSVGVTQDVGRLDEDLNIRKTRSEEHLTIGIMAALSLSVVLASAANANVWYNQNAAGFKNEASNLNANLFINFYDPSANMFRSIKQGAIAETVPTDSKHNNGYVFEAAEFEWISGESLVKTYEAPVRKKPPGYRRTFSAVCGGPVPMVDGDVINVPAGTLDDNPGLGLQRHIFVDFKVAWFDITDTLPRCATK